MRRIRIDIAKSLNFTGRLNDKERKFNISLQTSPGAIQNTRQDVFQYTVGNPPKRITRFFGNIYVMTHSGSLFSGATFIDTGFSDASFFNAASTALATEAHLFVAGGQKMRKVNSTNQILNWGLASPTNTLTPSAAGGTATIIGRYAYQYFAQVTAHRSNMSPMTSVFNSGGQTVQLSGFVASTDPQVTHQIILRDINGNGIFHEVAFKPNNTSNFTDTMFDADLVDQPTNTNDHGMPPMADLAVLWQGSAWLNDLTNTRRLWVSVPGRLEAFEVAGIFDLGQTSDDIRAFGVVGGNLYIWTQSKVWLVTGTYPTFSFVPIASLGLIGMYAIAFSEDRAVFASYSGVYVFNGATFSPLPAIWTLFDPDSPDARRFAGIDPKECVVSANDRFIWVGWRQTNNQLICFQYSTFTQAWTERDSISAIDPDRDPFHQLAGTYAGFVVNLNQGAHGPFTLVTPEVETDGAKMVSFEIDSVGVTFTMTPFVDGLGLSSVNIPPSATRQRSAFDFPESTFGKRVSFQLQSALVGPVGIADVYTIVEEIPLPVQRFDSGEVFMSNNEILPQHILLHVLAEQVLSLDVRLFMDGILAYAFNVEDIGPGYVGPLRLVVPPVEGRAARVILTSDQYFSVLNVSLGATPLGDETIKYAELGGEYPAMIRRRQQLQVREGAADGRSSQ